MVKAAVVLSWLAWFAFWITVVTVYVLTGESGGDTVTGRFVEVGVWLSLFLWIPPFILSMWADTR